ncbi:hypothetical protein MVEN_02448500 [Mycena venus]|uniref:FAD/NAD(P)-binding domain-containing protein n=1 Tax=Mycena venus TaxID=2733690 RepID=A0A8H6WYL3_9AGAR|nr:hypothetical protein MVEN_02448500 [Mycena venus]
MGFCTNLSIWLASTSCVLLTSGIIWQKICKCRPEWLKGLENLGQSRIQKLPGTAVVCGGSIAGIVTARIFADHFEHVIMVDPEINESHKPKTRIMQYNAAHRETVFLSLFIDGVRRLWPNFDEELLAAGGRLAPADVQLHYSGVPLLTPYQDYPIGRFPNTLVTRRSTAQNVLHRLLMQHPTAANITFLAGTVRGVTASDDMSFIQGVIVRNLEGTLVRLNDVALVADCTGTTQAGLKWLKNIGYPLPENIRCSYNGHWHYATVCFTVFPELEALLPIPEHATKTAIIYVNVPHFDYGSSMFGLFKTDNNTMQLLIGKSGDGTSMPRSAPDVVPFLSEIQGHAMVPSWVFETIAMLCESSRHWFDNIKIPSQSYVQYHLIPAGILPSNYIAIGDANLQLNPIHGQVLKTVGIANLRLHLIRQGFAKIIMNGLTLNSLLNKMDANVLQLPRDFAAHYFKENALHTHGLWVSTRLHDYGFPTCQPMEGETYDTGRLFRWFELRLVSAGTQNDEIASALWHVRHLLATERSLLAPTVLWKSLFSYSRF